MRRRRGPPGGNGLGQHRQVAARQAQFKLVEQPGGGFSFCRDAGRIHRGFQAFRVRKAADRQCR